MSRKLTTLTYEMDVKVRQTIMGCKKRGVALLVYSTLRKLECQAKLYRQSRPYSVILDKAGKFESRNFGWLGKILLDVGPVSGKLGHHVTNAAPGESWHNYGQAVDSVPMVHGKPVWDYLSNKSVWTIYGEEATGAGLYWAGNWARFKELPHIQLRESGNPLKVYSPDEAKLILSEVRHVDV